MTIEAGGREDVHPAVEAVLLQAAVEDDDARCPCCSYQHPGQSPPPQVAEAAAAAPPGAPFPQVEADVALLGDACSHHGGSARAPPPPRPTPPPEAPAHRHAEDSELQASGNTWRLTSCIGLRPGHTTPKGSAQDPDMHTILTPPGTEALRH